MHGAHSLLTGQEMKSRWNQERRASRSKGSTEQMQEQAGWATPAISYKTCIIWPSCCLQTFLFLIMPRVRRSSERRLVDSWYSGPCIISKNMALLSKWSPNTEAPVGNDLLSSCVLVHPTPRFSVVCNVALFVIDLSHPCSYLAMVVWVRMVSHKPHSCVYAWSLVSRTV